MIYKVTFNHGQVQEIEGDRIEDNGLKVIIWNGEDQYVLHDNDIVSITSNLNAPIDFADIYGHKEGVRLYNEDGRIIEAYRTVEELNK